MEKATALAQWAVGAISSTSLNIWFQSCCYLFLLHSTQNLFSSFPVSGDFDIRSDFHKHNPIRVTCLPRAATILTVFWKRENNLNCKWVPFRYVFKLAEKLRGTLYNTNILEKSSSNFTITHLSSMPTEFSIIYAPRWPERKINWCLTDCIKSTSFSYYILLLQTWLWYTWSGRNNFHQLKWPSPKKFIFKRTKHLNMKVPSIRNQQKTCQLLQF